MRLRFFQLLLLALVAAAAFAGVARALDFDDEDPEPPHGEVGMIYSYEIGTHAGCLPHRLEVASGQLPPGTELRRIDLDTHVLEGIPTQSGVFSAWIHLRDCDNRSAETLFRFEIWDRRWGIATQSLQPAAAGAPYSATLAGAGPESDTTWEITAGSLPAGLALSPSGTISGTPTAVGSSTFTVKATAKEKNFGPTRVDSKEYTLQVVSLAASLSRSVAEAGVRFNTTLVASGGTAPYTWTVTGAPAGLGVSASGLVSGVPRRAGSYTLNARFTDAAGLVGNSQVRLVVRARLAIVATALPSGAVGRAYGAKIAMRGGVAGFRWSATSLPAGLRIGASTGRITGVPARAGIFRVTVRVRDALGAVSKKTLRLTIR
jgi:hypothetical protein